MKTVEISKVDNMPKGWFGDNQAHSLAARGIHTRQSSSRNQTNMQPKPRPINTQYSSKRSFRDIHKQLDNELYNIYGGDSPIEIKDQDTLKVITDQGKYNITRRDLEYYYKFQIGSPDATKRLGKLEGDSNFVDQIAEELTYVFNRIDEEGGLYG